MHRKAVVLNQYVFILWIRSQFDMDGTSIDVTYIFFLKNKFVNFFESRIVKMNINRCSFLQQNILCAVSYIDFQCTFVCVCLRSEG